MAQLNPNQYIKIGGGGPTYGSSDGLYYDKTNSKLVLAVAGSVVASWATTGLDDLVSGETRGDILRRGASSWERHVALTSGQVLLGDGADIKSTALSGDVTVNGSGVTAIGADKVLSAMTSPLLLKYASVPVSSAELLAINATPKTLVAAAAGYVHIVHAAILVLNYNSAAYANNGVLGIYETNASGTLLTGTLTLASFLAQTADTIKELHPTAASATTGLTRVDNKAIVLTQATGESISGNSPINVHLWYSTIPHGL